MITILHRGGGSLGTPKSDYVICARPLTFTWVCSCLQFVFELIFLYLALFARVLQLKALVDVNAGDQEVTEKQEGYDWAFNFNASLLPGFQLVWSPSPVPWCIWNITTNTTTNITTNTTQLFITSQSPSQSPPPSPPSRVTELGSLSSGAKMARKIFVKCAFTIFATITSFLCVIANLQI